jgi:hypothetical protein
MPRVYLDTSLISAGVGDRDDPASIYRRRTTLEWWKTQAPRHELFVSGEVLAELSHRNYPHRQAALIWASEAKVLSLTDEVVGFASILVRERLMPLPIAGDAIHVAAAAVHSIDYLLSWNVRHLANPNKLAHLQTICLRHGLTAPWIVTPDLLWETSDDRA